MKDTKTKKIECSNNAIRRKEKRENRKTQIRNEKIRMPKRMAKRQKQKRAQRFIKYSVADSLTEITVLSAYLCRANIIYHQAKENHIKRTKCAKNTVFPYTLVL